LRILPQVLIYLVLFLVAFEGLRRSVAQLSWLGVAPYTGSAATVTIMVVVVLAIAFAAAGFLAIFLFFGIYVAWRASRPAAVFSVSLGLYAWTLLIALNVLWIVVSLPSDIARVSQGEQYFLIVVEEVISIALLGSVFVVCAAVLRRTGQEFPHQRITHEVQPGLWTAIEETAGACGVTMPAEVYWLPKANAQVMHFGGWLGFGGRPVLGIGLPLLRVLRRDELRAALAHEFHHLRRGDAFLFASIYNARQDAEHLQAGVRWLPAGIFGTLTQTAFRIYSSILWRLSKPVVRAWEYEADAFATRVVSSGTMARTLVKLDLAQTRFEAFRRNWLEPALESGYLPPVMRGFWEYYHQCALEERNYRRLITSREVNRESETHPPLRDRILRLGQRENLCLSRDFAFDLVENPELVEAGLYSREGLVREDEWDSKVLQKIMAAWRSEVLAGTRRRRGSKAPAPIATITEAPGWTRSSWVRASCVTTSKRSSRRRTSTTFWCSANWTSSSRACETSWPARSFATTCVWPGQSCTGLSA
jgi:Zn-dependent protease with chaperone function